MAKLDLREGEELIEQAAASHVKKVLIMPQANPGNLFVTNQRVVFRPTQGRPSSQFEYELSDLRGGHGKHHYPAHQVRRGAQDHRYVQQEADQRTGEGWSGSGIKTPENRNGMDCSGFLLW